MENRKFNDENNELINRLAFLKGKLHQLHGWERKNVKESLEEEIETLKQKLNLNTPDKLQKIRLKIMFPELFDMEKT